MNHLVVSIVAWWIAEGSGLSQYLRWWLKVKKIWYKMDHFNMVIERRIKPFDCPLCLAFWISTIYFWNDYSIVELIASGIVCSTLAIFIDKIYRRI